MPEAGFAWWPWVVGGIALATAEMLLPGAYLLWIGLGAAATGLVALVVPGLGLSGQLATFAVAATLAGAGGIAVYRRTGAAGEGGRLNRRARDLVGAPGIVEVAFRAGQGRVRIADGSWPARGPDLPEGAAVTVVACDPAHAILEVRPG